MGLALVFDLVEQHFNAQLRHTVGILSEHCEGGTDNLAPLNIPESDN